MRALLLVFVVASCGQGSKTGVSQRVEETGSEVESFAGELTATACVGEGFAHYDDMSIDFFAQNGSTYHWGQAGISHESTSLDDVVAAMLPIHSRSEAFISALSNGRMDCSWADGKPVNNYAKRADGSFLLRVRESSSCIEPTGNTTRIVIVDSDAKQRVAAETFVASPRDPNCRP